LKDYRAGTSDIFLPIGRRARCSTARTRRADPPKIS
jgi:hypothetical protein